MEWSEPQSPKFVFSPPLTKYKIKLRKKYKYTNTEIIIVIISIIMAVILILIFILVTHVAQQGQHVRQEFNIPQSHWIAVDDDNID